MRVDGLGAGVLLLLPVVAAGMGDVWRGGGLCVVVEGLYQPKDASPASGMTVIHLTVYFGIPGLQDWERELADLNTQGQQVKQT